MADLPITSDQGATPVVINDPTTAANVANVKAASTAALATDLSLVVALSPNSAVPTGTNKIGQTGVAQASTTSGQNGDLIQGAVTTTAPTYVTAQTSPLSLTIAGALRVDGSAVNQPVVGTKTNNNAAPGATNVGVLPALANAAAPTWTEGDLVLESVDLAGRQRVNATLGNTDGKTNVLKTGTLVTTAVTADQVVLTYTVTAAKTFYVEYLSIDCSLTVAPTNFNSPVVFGTVSLETPSGTKDISWRWMGPQPQQDHITFSEPIPVAAGVVIRVVVTPGITTSLTWVANFGGYER